MSVSEHEERLSDSEVARRGTRGALTYVVRTGVAQLVQAVSALAVARVLSPSSYGVFALALTLVATVRLVGDLGITYTLVVERHVDESELRAGCAVALGVAVLGGAVVSLIWSRLAIVHAAGHSALWVVPVLAMTVVIAVPADPSTVMLERRLEFSRLGVIGVVQAVALFGAQVALLLCGLGLWAMVVAQLVGASVGTILTLRASGRLYVPSIRGPIARLIRQGLPYQSSLVASSLAGTASSIVVAAELGVRGIGLFAWCTILATPLMGALLAVHSASAPTLARMRRNDGSRYEESVTIMTRAAGSLAAVGSGCLIGLVHPTIEYVFGARWLPATTAVQLCLAGTIPLAIMNALAADANARQMRRITLLAALAGGAASLITLVPLAAVAGVGGASIAAYCVGPATSVAVFAAGLHARIWPSIFGSLRLFVPLAAFSFALARLATGPLGFVVACILAGSAAAGAVLLGERLLATRILRQLRRQPVAEHVV